MRWARVSLCALGMSVVLLVVTFPALTGFTDLTALTGLTAPTGLRAGADTAGNFTTRPALSLAAQTAWVSPAAPWFALTAQTGSDTGSLDDLHVEATFYNRINDETELAQATHAVPDKGILDHFNWPVTATSEGRIAATCVTVLPEQSVTPPTT